MRIKYKDTEIYRGSGNALCVEYLYDDPDHHPPQRKLNKFYFNFSMVHDPTYNRTGEVDRIHFKAGMDWAPQRMKVTMEELKSMFNIFKKNGISILLIILICAFIGGWWFYKSLQSEQLTQQAQLSDDINKIMFVPLDEITVNLKHGVSQNMTWLRIKVTLEVQGKNNYDVVSQLTPKIVDIVQTYLKELRQSDLEGSFGIYKIKDEMMMRINTVLHPVRIEAILFQEMIIQTT